MWHEEHFEEEKLQLFGTNKVFCLSNYPALGGTQLDIIIIENNRKRSGGFLYRSPNYI